MNLSRYCWLAALCGSSGLCVWAKTSSSRPTLRSGGSVLTERRSTEEGSFSLPDGIWSSRGYGMVLNVTNGQVNLLEETETSCVANNMLLEYIDAGPEVTGDSAIVTASTATLNDYVFDRSDVYNAGCSNGITPGLGDEDYIRNPLTDFDILVQTFREHYAFFEQRSIDWETLAAEHRFKLTSNSTDADLWQVLVDLVTPLEDPHVMLFNGEEMLRAKDLDFEYYLSQKAKWHDIAATYMQEGALIGKQDIPIYWGKVDSSVVVDGRGVGYIELGTMEADTDTFAAFVEAMEEAIQSLQDTHTIVLDLRFNLGGSDAFALRVASLFAAERTQVGSKRAKDGSGWTSRQQVYIEPVPDPSKRYTGNVILLTSGWTVSAAEVFTMSMMQLPQTTLLGRNTIGAFSDQLQKMMPNNWRFALTNEVYEDASGQVYEISGIPPDVYPEAEFMDQTDEENGIDSWLERAREVAAEKAILSSIMEDDPSSSAFLSYELLPWHLVAGLLLLCIAI